MKKTASLTFKDVNGDAGEAESRYRSLIEDSHELIQSVKPDGHFDFVNSAWLKTLGYKRKELEKIKLFDIIAPEHIKQCVAKFKKVLSGRRLKKVDAVFVSKKGERIFVQGAVSPRIKGGRVFATHGFFRDMTDEKKSIEKLKKLNIELKKYNKKLQRLSLIDSHTGLFNHRYITEMIEAEFFRAKRSLRHLSVIMIDIDYFKAVNDVYGHSFGDLVLKQFAKYLKDKVRKYDAVARFGGEEFVIISPGTSREAVLKLARRIIDFLPMNYFGNSDTKIKMKVSAGVASYPEDEVDVAMRLIDKADRIMAKAKEDGGNRAYSSLEVKSGILRTLNTPEKKVSVGNLKSTITKLSKRSNQSLVEAIFAFAKTLKMKDLYTGEHVEKTVQYAIKIAKAMKLTPAKTEKIRQAAILHDLGKVGIRGSILRKRTELTKREYEEIKKHPQIAADILRGVHFMHDIIPLILHHHEWYDGKGYPSGMKGGDIPLGARIIAVADVYQSLISDRSYSRAHTKSDALKIIQKAAGTQFDPEIVKHFLKAMKSGD